MVARLRSTLLATTVAAGSVAVALAANTGPSETAVGGKGDRLFITAVACTGADCATLPSDDGWRTRVDVDRDAGVITLTRERQPAT